MAHSQPSHRAREIAASDKESRGDLEIEEELAGTLINRSMWSRLWPLLTPVRKRLAVVVGVEVLLVVVVFLRPWFFRQVIDHGLPRAGAGAVWAPRVVLTMGAGLTLC